MKLKAIYISLFLFACVVIPASMQGQVIGIDEVGTDQVSPLSQAEYEAEDLKPRPLDEDAWKRLSSELEIEQWKKKPEKERKEPVVTRKKATSKSPVWKTLLFVLVLAALVFVLVLISRLGLFRSNPAMEGKTRPVVSEINPDTPRGELESRLDEALARSDFRQALRISFLMVLQELHQRELIGWKREKTNADYLSELPSAGMRDSFGILSTIFSWTWYGEYPVDKPAFDRVYPLFTHFLQSIKTPGK